MEGSLIAYKARGQEAAGRDLDYYEASADYAADSVAERIVEGGAPLGQLVDWVEQAAEASQDARELGERCRDYSDNKQLTPEERRILASRGQPEVIRNKIKRKVLFLRGWEARNRSDPRAFANKATAEDDASKATDMLRFQERKNRLDKKFSQVWDNMIHEGYGAIEVLGPSARDPRVIEVKRWRWDRLFHDPHSCEPDFSDARYLGGFIWEDHDQIAEKWPDADDAMAATLAGDGSTWGRTYDDKPTRFAWTNGVNGKRKRVRIVQIDYFWKGVWWRCLFVKGGKLEDYPLPYVDEQGNSLPAMFFHSAYVDRENNRYGEVAEWLSLQDDINKRHSKALHEINSTQTIAEQGAILDVDEFKRQKARPDGHMELAPGALTGKKFEFIERREQSAANLQMLQIAEVAFDKAGPNSALMGTQSGAPSGRAIRANQEGGLIEIEPLRDEHNDFKQRVYEGIWYRCKQFVTAETWIEVSDDRDTARPVAFNRPIPMAEQVAEEARARGVSEDEIVAQMEMADQDPELSAQLRQVVGHEGVIAKIDIDIIIEPASESINMAHEAFEFVSQDPTMPFEIKLELWPGTSKQKRRIRDLIDKMQAKQAEANAAASQLQAESVKADIEKKRASAMKDMAAADQAQMATQMAPVEAATKARAAAAKSGPGAQSQKDSPYVTA
jgi:hypothetical protein